MTISFANLMMSYTILMLFLPMAAFEVTSIYHSGSIAAITYDWLNYDFSFLLLPIIFGGTIIYFKHFDWRYIFLPIILFIQDMIRVFFMDYNILELNSYEMYLSYLSGFLAAFICFYAIREKQLKYFHVFWFMNVCTQIIGAITGIAGFANRFNAVNLDVVGTGEISGICLALLIFSTTKWTWFEKLLVPVYIVSIFLSGTRNPLVFLAILAFIYFFKNFYNLKKIRWYIISPLILLPIMVCGYSFIDSNNRVFETMSDILQFISFYQGEGTDLEPNSVIGRFDSMTVAINVLKDYPWGVGNGFIILQSYMQDYGYPTFPHSYFLCGWMLWGGWVWLILGYGICKLWKLHRQGSSLVYWGIYILMIFFLSGGPIVNFKTWFCYIFLFLIISHKKYVNTAEI